MSTRRQKSIITITDTGDGVSCRIEFDPPINANETTSNGVLLGLELLKLAPQVAAEIEDTFATGRAA